MYKWQQKVKPELPGDISLEFKQETQNTDNNITNELT